MTKPRGYFGTTGLGPWRSNHDSENDSGDSPAFTFYNSPVADKGCSACGAPLDDHNSGIELWGTKFCSTCFIGNSAKLHKELTPEDIALIKIIGKELAGFLPPELLEMLAVGFYRRVTGKSDVPPPAELARFVGEIQRLAFFSYARKEMNLLKKWQDTFNEFVEDNEHEIRENIKKLTDLEE